MQNSIQRLSFTANRVFSGAAWSFLVGERPPSQKVKQPSVSSKETHWHRVTTIVELSLARVTDMMSSQAAASNQIHAAEYALHSLLSELGTVMATGIRSPLEARQAAAQVTLPAYSALAA